MKNKTKESSLLALPLLMCLSVGSIASPDPQPNIPDVQGNLVTNGNFEQIDASVGEHGGNVLNNVAWRGSDVYQTIPGWFTSFGQGIEIQRGAQTDPHLDGGGQVVEMDSTVLSSGMASNSWMSQKISSLSPGANYTLRFKYHRNPKTNNQQHGRGIAVYWGERIPGKNTCNATAGTDAWIDFECVVTASGADMFLTFAAFGDEGTGTWGDNFGGLIDIVTLLPTP